MGATAADVAAYILAREGKMTTMKLQKLVYYSQACALATTGEPIFTDAIKAWREGPVVPDIFHAAGKGARHVERLTHGKSDAVSDRAAEAITLALKRYGALTGDELSRLTHTEAPWMNARASEAQSPTIELASIKAWFCGEHIDLDVPWEDEPVDVNLADELAHLRGEGPDPWPTSSSTQATSVPPAP